MTKRELNKKLKSKTLEIRNAVGIKDGIVRVIRVRKKNIALDEVDAIWG